MKVGVAENVQLILPEGAMENYKADKGYNADHHTWWGIPLPEEPVEEVVTVKINGNEIAEGGLESAIASSSVKPGDVTSLEFVSGKITAEDLKYIKDNVKYLETLKMNLSSQLVFINKEGAESTVLPASAFRGTNLVHVELAGFTEIGARAFEEATKLETVQMPNMEVIEMNAFYCTDEYENIILPASIQKLNDCGFGVAKNGTKATYVTMEGAIPPELKGRVFKEAKSGSYVIVPEGSLTAYLPKLDLSKTFGESGETVWGTLKVVDPAYGYVTFYQTEEAKAWETTYGYVKKGTPLNTVAVQNIKVPEGKTLKEWNTQKDGKGTAVALNAVVTEDMTLYPVFKENLIANATYSNVKDDKVETLYNGTVTVTITANKALDRVVIMPAEETVEKSVVGGAEQESENGWEKVDEKTFTKTFKDNNKELVKVQDVDGFEADVTIQVQGIIIDTTNPEITVDKAGTVTVVDENLASVMVDGKPVELDENNQFALSFGKHKVVATDLAGNESTWEGEILDPDAGEGENPGGGQEGGDQKPGGNQKPGGDQSQSGDKKPGGSQSQTDDKKPGNGQKPADNKKPGSGSTKQPEQKKDVAVKSGDHSAIGWYVGLLLGCVMVFGILDYRRKKN